MDAAADAVSRLVLDARDELSELRRTARLAIVRSVADGKVPKVGAKAVAALAAARDRSEYLEAASSGNLTGSLYSVARDRASEAMHATPVTTAAQVVTLAAVLRTHEAVRRSLGLRPTSDGRPTADAVLKVVSAVRAVMRWMYEAGHLQTLPPEVRVPPPHKPRERVATDAEAAALIAAAIADDQQQRRSLVGPLVLLALASGLRISEALALTWGHGLDLTGDELLIRVADSKTTAGEREVLVLDRATVNAMRAHRLATGRPADGSPVFAREDGQTYKRHGAPRYGLNRVRAAAGRALLASEGVPLLGGDAGKD